MPQKTLPKCIQCENGYSPMWRNTDNGQICQTCYELDKSKTIKSEAEANLDQNDNSNNGGGVGGQDEKKLRKSTRSTRYKARANANAALAADRATAAVGSNNASGGTAGTVSTKPLPKGRNRRNIFKKNPVKSPVVTATTTVVDSLFFNGIYVQVGDIVSLVDYEDNTYYAQIRGLLVDTYCEKSAFLTWLIPTKSSPPPNKEFDPSTYLIGPDEDCPRKLNCLEFIMHAPSNYFHNKTMPYPLPDGDDDYAPHSNGFIWTNMSTASVIKQEE